MISVRAKAVGYYGGRVRDPGDRFTIVAEEEFSGSWMVRLKPRRLTTDELVAAPPGTAATAMDVDHV